MSHVAICPTCNTENVASRTSCSLCGGTLHEPLLGRRAQKGASQRVFNLWGVWVVLGAAITAVFCLVCVLFELSGFAYLLAAFYGAMIPSYLCRSNVVFETSMGAVFGWLGPAVLVLVVTPDTMRVLISTLVGFQLHSIMTLVLFSALSLALVYPFALLGASAGAYIRQRRRKRAALANGAGFVQVVPDMQVVAR